MGYDVAVHYVTVQGPLFISIGDNAVTSSIRIAQYFPNWLAKKTRAIWKVYRGMLKYIIN